MNYKNSRLNFLTVHLKTYTFKISIYKIFRTFAFKLNFSFLQLTLADISIKNLF